MKLSGLYVFEGADGVGKTTLAGMFCKLAQEHGTDPLLLSFPGHEKGSLGELVYRIHHWPEKFELSSLLPASLQLLHVAAHVDTISRVIQPHLRQNGLVVLDRYWWSTWVYGRSGGLSREMTSAILAPELLQWRDRQPDVVFHLLRKTPLRPEPLTEWLQLSARYERLAQRSRDQHPVFSISNDGTPEETLELIESAASSL